MLNGDRVLDHTTLELLHPAHLLRLLGNGHALVDDANAALLGQRNGEARLGHGVHGRRHQRNVQLDAAGETGTQRHITGNHVGVPGQQQYVIEREGFLGDTQHGRSPAGRWQLNVQL